MDRPFRIPPGIIGAAMLVLSSPVLAADIWITEETQNCEVWSDELAAEGDFIAWSGDCSGGKASGQGLLIWLRNETLYTRYEGGMSAGKLDGPGLLLVKSDDDEVFEVVIGSFREGLPHGSVTYLGADRSLFQGAFVDGLKDGPGRFVDAEGNSFAGMFRDDRASGSGHSVSTDGEEYLGTFAGDERHGYGVLIGSDGSVYTGDFESGSASGSGTFESLAGVYEGGFADNMPNGPGTFVSEEGDIYQGRFRNGDPDGQIVVTDSDGNQRIKIWENGEMVR